MSELIHGPIQKWEPSPEERVTIERLEQSTSDIDNSYAEAYSQGLFVKEWATIAAVGELDAIKELEFRTGIEIEVGELGLGDCVNITWPGQGNTRAERVRDGIRKALEARHR